MKTRIASWAAAAALTVSAVVATAAPASAETLPDRPAPFYTYCWGGLLGVPVGCTLADTAYSWHLCHYVATPFGLGVDCVRRAAE
jgi:hypothetical protein